VIDVATLTGRWRGRSYVPVLLRELSMFALQCRNVRAAASNEGASSAMCPACLSSAALIVAGKTETDSFSTKDRASCASKRCQSTAEA
jgi:hypothetical protein